MSGKLIIGTSGRHAVGFDIPELLVSRLLVQASSGGGKSFLLRRLLEQGFGKVQEIVIDIAGEFATLREEFGFVLVGEHGETPADIRSAGLVAEKLLELKASAVCDLYSLKPALRHKWVQLFLTAVMNAPKRLWHPVLFVVDEAHKFCPEKGEGESEAKEAMLSLASDGRKYGFCAAFATQRLAKLDKSAASELLNVMIGPTWIDIDLARAHKALGIVPKDQAAFNEQMKTIAPGHFYALGRAISKTRILVKVGAIQTTHPTAGSGKYSAEPPPPPEKVKLLLPKLADLPQEAETKARTEAEFRREIRELRGKLTAAEKKAATPAPARVVPDPRATQLAIERELAAAIRTRDAAWMRAVLGFQRHISTIAFAAPPARAVQNVPARLVRQAPDDCGSRLGSNTPGLIAAFDAEHELKKASSVALARQVDRQITGEGEVKLAALHRQIAGILAGYYPEPMKITVLASMLDRTPGGSFSARLSECRAAGVLEDRQPGYVGATETSARQYLGTFQAPSTTEEVLAIWEPKWSAVNREIMRYLIAQGGEAVPIVQLAEGVGKTPGGSFSARISEVRSSGLLVDGRGTVAANRELLFLDDRPVRALA
jgi:hypothetical protein